MDKIEGKIMKMNRYSYGIVLPKKFVRELKWREKQRIIANLRDAKIIVEDWRKKQKYDERKPVKTKKRPKFAAKCARCAKSV